ncbi:WD40-like Beta Propeller Repeat [Pedobacter steynii]|uniref:WD40-like Beta Propeller Repeat n=1 Tax=Pedobacter steynii TaxID=430522 RepID=A0A1H0KCJ2_9SPHI|nr:PD40 domain-containing protein [Pedobacter steynii]NQX43256.1 PD40 domain-containing protein [Pedobacter steynii]SDO53678.1 WD40-like Beta Propeller Repeat [Pedobacter steynii]
MPNNLPVVNWVTLEGDFKDYRPAIGPDGKKVVFERSFNGETQLYMVQDLQGNNPQPLLPQQATLAQTRPDWNWMNNTIVLNISDQDNVSVCTVNADGSDLTKLSGTERYYYPQWASLSPDSNNGFVVMNNTDLGNPKSTLIDGLGNIIPGYIDMNGTDSNGKDIFGGMPAVFPGQSTLIAFAGQSKWTPATKYNQDKNYIFLNTENNGVFTSSPMESSASITTFDPDFQGRAPAISPDGKFIAFESTRNHGYSIYLFNLSDPDAIAVQLTDTSVAPNAQHPKFSPDGQRLIFCANNPEVRQRRIAWIDISEYL